MSRSHWSRDTWVINWIHGQTSQFTVWTNQCQIKQNSRQINFVPDSRLPFAQISSIYRKRPRKPETGIKDGFEEMEHEFPFGTFRSEKQDYFFRNFPLKRPEKSCSIHSSTGFSGKFFL